MSEAIRSTIKNHILAALPGEEYQRLVPNLEPVELAAGQILYKADEPIRYVYFTNNSLVSLLNILDDGTTLEVGIVGKEGAVGIPVLMGEDTALYQTLVQTAGEAQRIRAEALKEEFKRGGKLQDLLLRYTRLLLMQISHTAVCNRFHRVEERLARWLLMAHNRLDSDDIPFTQEFLSHMLGVRRSGVTIAAGALQKAGLIRYSRGRITVTDRQGLEEAACECYRIAKDEFDGFLNT